MHFCWQFSLTPLPVSEYRLCAFATHLSDAVSLQTIHSYLCAVRFYHIRNNLPDPSNVSMPKLATERRAQENTRLPKADPPPSHSRCAKTNSLPMVQKPCYLQRYNVMGSFLSQLLWLPETW